MSCGVAVASSSMCAQGSLMLMAVCSFPFVVGAFGPRGPTSAAGTRGVPPGSRGPVGDVGACGMMVPATGGGEHVAGVDAVPWPAVRHAGLMP